MGDQWNYDKADLEQGGYFRINHNGDKCAVIFPFDQQQPIEHGNNAWLQTRDFGTDHWQDRGVHSFSEAKQRGDAHVHEYAKDVAKQLLDQAKGRSQSDDGMSF